MKFTVVWTPSALNKLANLWMQAEDAQAVTNSANRIERELKFDAHLKGVPLQQFRALYDDPLAVLYLVKLPDCTAWIIDVNREIGRAHV